WRVASVPVVASPSTDTPLRFVRHAKRRSTVPLYEQLRGNRFGSSVGIIPIGCVIPHPNRWRRRNLAARGPPPVRSPVHLWYRKPYPESKIRRICPNTTPRGISPAKRNRLTEHCFTHL